GPHDSKLGSGGGCNPTVASGLPGPRSTAGPGGSGGRCGAGARDAAEAARAAAPGAGRDVAARVPPPQARPTASSAPPPPQPLPTTALRSTPSSRARRRVAGVAGTGSSPRAVDATVPRGGSLTAAEREEPAARSSAPAAPNVTSTSPT